MEAQMPRVATIRFLSALVLLLFATGSPVCYADPTVNAASEEQPLLLAVNDGLQQKETIGVTSSEVLLGSCVPLTGVIQKRAESVIDGASSYIDYVNDKGGVNGRKIKLVSCDDGFSPDKAVECFNSCLKDKVFAGTFFMGSSAVVRYVRMGDASRMPMVGFNTGIPVTCEFSPYRFNLRPCFADEVRRQLHELIDVQHLTKIGIIYQSDALGASARQAAVEELKARGMAPVAEASCSRSVTDSEAPYEQIKAHHPQAVILAAGTPALQYIIRKRNADKWNVPFITLSQVGDVLTELGRDADGILATQVIPRLDAHAPAVQLYIHSLKKYHPSAKPEIHGLEAFLNAVAIVEALKRAGPDLTRTKFLDALESLHGFDLGLEKTYKVTYGARKHVAWGTNNISLEIMRDGSFVPVKPEDWTALTKDSN